MVSKLLPEGEEVGQAIRKDTDHSHSDSEPEIARLVVDLGLNQLKDEASSALEDVVDRERLGAGIIEFET